MSKSKADYWLTKDGRVLLEGWARDGLTENQISKNMGISLSTLSSYKLKYSEILDALKKGKEVADYEVENALFSKALSGDVAAMIFWLKNRKPSKWRDRVDVGISKSRNDAADELEKHFKKRKPNKDSGILSEQSD